MKLRVWGAKGKSRREFVQAPRVGPFLDEQFEPILRRTQLKDEVNLRTDQPASSWTETLPPSASERPGLPRAATLGRYVLIDLLGKGGMGVVFAAFDPELDRKVAVKLLSSEAFEHMQETDGKARLLREAKAMARLSHPNVIAVHDVGTFRDEVFIAMEYVDGCTLGEWLSTKHNWCDIVEIFVQAGRGLSAAHSAGIVHRDFKPENVLVDKDGRARVLDFGLARGIIPAEEAQTVQLKGDGPSAAAISPRAFGDGGTKTGALMGTPSYMAPEQLAGKQVDARTDQFSFCVALYQALYGELPFEGDTLRERITSIERGRIRPPRAGGKIPKWLHDVVTKGLNSNPQARHPSMEALLQELQRHPSRFWTQLAAVAAVVLLLGGTAWTSYRFQHNKRQICGGAEEKLASVWNEAQKQAVFKAFLATSLPYASDSIRSVNRLLDNYAKNWIAMRTEACEATHLRGEQSGELLDLRMSCLSQRFEELKALTQIFVKADSKVIEKSVDAASRLSGIQDCADAAALKAPLKLPADVTLRAKVEEVRSKISNVRALNEAGKYSDALTLARQAVQDGERLAYSPVQAEALFALARNLTDMGEYRESEKTALRAALTAESARHDETAARAWGELSFVSSMLTKHDSAELFAKLCFIAIDRLGGNDQLRARMLGLLGLVNLRRTKYEEALNYFRQALALTEHVLGPREVAHTLTNMALALRNLGKYDEALVHLERALALKQEILGPMHPELAITLLNIGVVMNTQGNYQKALPYYQRSLEIKEQSLGPNHPTLALNLQGLGNIFQSQKRYEEALRAYDRARSLNEEALGESHPLLADNLVGMGNTYLELDQPRKALLLLERALEMYESTEVDAARAGQAKFRIARALVKLNRDPRRARTLAEQSRSAFKKSAWAHKDLEEAEQWLSKNFPK